MFLGVKCRNVWKQQIMSFFKIVVLNLSNDRVKATLSLCQSVCISTSPCGHEPTRDAKQLHSNYNTSVQLNQVCFKNETLSLSRTTCGIKS